MGFNLHGLLGLLVVFLEASLQLIVLRLQSLLDAGLLCGERTQEFGLELSLQDLHLVVAELPHEVVDLTVEPGLQVQVHFL
eukprot:CAMPEP_0170508776 /NCGR_PEP_ID=MMETSP0208-20121228/63410_1 /TAXON_ID=197538 /ORGANISM="Strombidium inclinatum, Strain S3" /LENGTH=80 /DNA_ID=CAMNT_0010791873 /DNA_START=342 /DNA_END=580 /DNA_ORIENTATION=+